jgi:hypothetical protein
MDSIFVHSNFSAANIFVLSPHSVQETVWQCISPNYLPSITLLCFCFICITSLLKLYYLIYAIRFIISSVSYFIRC